MLKKIKIVSPYPLVILSALCYTLPFLTPALWWLIFLFPLPLFLAVLYHYSPPYLPASYDPTYQLSFRHGFLWGIIVYGLHLQGVYDGISRMAAGSPALYPFLLVASLACSLALHSGLWFYVSALTLRIVGKKMPLALWLITTTLYIYWIDSSCLWPLLRIEGYPFTHPLIPLTAHPQLLSFLPILHKPALTFFLLLPAAALARYLFTPRTKNLLILLVTLMFWIFFSLLSPHLFPHLYLQQTGRRTLPIGSIARLALQIKSIGQIKSTGSHADSRDTGDKSESLIRVAHYKCKQILRTQSATNLIILPESALYSCTVCSSPHGANLWSENGLEKAIALICGSYEQEKNQTYNTCFLFFDGTRIQKFRKKHTVPFAEQVPSWCDIPSMHALFCSEIPAITPSDNERLPFMIPEVGSWVPYICSELFFLEKPDDAYPGVPILALVNDARFISSGFKENMLKVAQLKAIEWGREVLYVSYAYGVYIDKNGYVHQLENS